MIALQLERRIGMPNQKLPGTDTGPLIFAPAATSIVFEDETGEDIDYPVDNDGDDPNEPRFPAGQPGGGQWTSAGAGGMQSGKRHLQMAPSTPLLSGGNARTGGALAQDLPPAETLGEFSGEVAEVWEVHLNIKPRLKSLREGFHLRPESSLNSTCRVAAWSARQKEKFPRG